MQANLDQFLICFYLFKMKEGGNLKKPLLLNKTVYEHLFNLKNINYQIKRGGGCTIIKLKASWQKLVFTLMKQIGKMSRVGAFGHVLGLIKTFLFPAFFPYL